MTDQTSEPPTARRGVLYPNGYCWFVLLSSLDIMLTHTILHHFAHMNGREVNTFADFIIERAGIWGAIGLKCASIVVVVVILEFVGRKRPATGRTLMACVLAMAMVPVFVALVQLAWVAISP